jgi:hypothetical protein
VVEVVELDKLLVIVEVLVEVLDQKTVEEQVALLDKEIVVEVVEVQTIMVVVAVEVLVLLEMMEQEVQEVTVELELQVIQLGQQQL